MQAGVLYIQFIIIVADSLLGKSSFPQILIINKQLCSIMGNNM